MNSSKYFLSLHSVGVSLLLITLASSAFAADKDKAKAHFASGKALMRVDNFDGAALEFEASIASYPTKNALFNLSQCYRALSRYGEALRVLDRLTNDFGDSMSRQMKKSVAEIGKEIKGLAAYLRVVVDLPDATITIDGKPAGKSPLTEPIVLAPGSHRIEVASAGYETERRSLRLMSRENKEESFSLRPVKQEEPGPMEEIGPVSTEPSEPSDELPATEGSATKLSVWSWSGIAITGALVVATAVVGGIYLENGFTGEDYVKKGYNDENSDKHQLYLDMADKHKKLQPATIGLVATTAAFAIATTVLVALDLKKAKKEQEHSGAVRLKVIPGGVRLVF